MSALSLPTRASASGPSWGPSHPMPFTDRARLPPPTWSHHKYSGYNACDPRPDASSPHGQGGSSDTNTIWAGGRGSNCHRGHVITKEDGPEAQTDREMAVQPHPGPPSQTPVPPMPTSSN